MVDENIRLVLEWYQSKVWGYMTVQFLILKLFPFRISTLVTSVSNELAFLIFQASAESDNSDETVEKRKEHILSLRKETENTATADLFSIIVS